MPASRIAFAMLVAVIAWAGLSSPVAQGAPGAQYAPGPLRDTMPLERGWRFLRADVSSAHAPGFDDAGWRTVNVPHTWNALDGQDGGNSYYRGIGWYRRHMVIPAAWTGRRLWLEFDGANTTTKAWVNGAQVGEHQGGYARFRFDVTDAVRPGQDNVLAVSVSNAANADLAPLSGDFTMGGGLYRDVRLVATDPLHVDMSDYGGPGIVLRTRRLTPAEAHVDAIVQLSDDTAVDRNAMVRTIITDARQRPVAWSSWTATQVPAHGRTTVTQSIVIRQPHLWDGQDDPYLYRAVVEVADADTGRITDSIAQPLGLRTVTIDANTGLWLNGRHVRLQGVNMHQDRQDKGWAISHADHVQDFALMRDMGVNAIRTAHYQHAPAVYDLADQGGFLVWTEIPLVNRTTSSPAFAANIEQQTREMVRQNINHPSVVTWGMGNELWSDDTPTSTLVGALAASAKSDDPSRPTSYASCCIRDDGAVNATVDLNGYNKYFGWYYGTFADFGKWADDLHASNIHRRIAVSEYGASGSIGQHTDDMTNPDPSSTWHPEEYQSLLHEVYWKAIETRPFLWGSFVWCMFDFASDSRSDGAIPGRNDKGMVSYDRKVLKDPYYWYQANWTKRPVLHLNSKGWTRRTAASTNVKVYTNTDKVTLFVNGMPVGSPQSGADRVVVWPNVTLQPGPNRITVVGENLSDSATWTLVP